MKELELQRHGECLVVVSHRLNKDGYFRKRVNGKLVMYHRHVWEQVNGPIPAGFEIDHMCNNRACCNVEHLQALPGSVHATESNQFRYSALRGYAKTFWLASMCTGTELAKEFGVSVSAANGWIRGWKACQEEG